MLYFILSYNNRLASDDIVFFALSKNQNLFQYISSFYETWSGRWTSGCYFYLITSVANSFQNIHIYIFLYYCLTIFLFIYSVKTILHFCISKFFKISLDAKTTLLYSILFIASFYYFTFQCSEVWWWVCASVDTLQGIVFLLFGIALLTKEEKSRVHYILICTAFIYVGSCFEIYALIIEALLFTTFVYYYFSDRKRYSEFKNSRSAKGIYIGIISLVLSSIVCFTAPGNRNRRNAESKNFTKTAVVYKQNTLLETGKNLFTQKKYIVAFGLSALWLLLGMKLQNGEISPEEKKRIKKLLIVCFIPLILSIIITESFQLLILRDYSIPERAWTFTSFSLSFFCCLLFLIAGYTIRFKLFALDYLIKIVVPLLIALLLSFNFIKQYYYTTEYAKAYDRLMVGLINSKADKEIESIQVKALPEPGMLIPLDISDDYIKVPLKEILDLNCEIRVLE